MRRQIVRLKSLSLCLAFYSLACEGAIGEGAGGAGQTAKPDPVLPDAAPGNPRSTPGDPRAAGPMPLRRLSNREYDNTVHDLLGDTSAPAQQFPGDHRD